MTINWDIVNAVAESTGSIAVVVTLVYLSAQIRQNTRALMSQRYDERTKALRALDTLTPTERGRLASHSLSVWNHYQNMFYQHEIGFLDDALFQASQQTVSRLSRFWIALGFSQEGLTEYDRFVRAAASA